MRAICVFAPLDKCTNARCVKQGLTRVLCARATVYVQLWRYSRRELNNVMSISGDEQFRSIILMLKLFEAATKEDLAATRASLAKHEEKLYAMHTNTELKLAALHADIQSLLQRQDGGVMEKSFMRSSSGGGGILPDFQKFLRHGQGNIVKERATDVLAGGGEASSLQSEDNHSAQATFNDHSLHSAGMNPAGAIGVTPTVFKHGVEVSGYGSGQDLASREAPPSVMSSLSVLGFSEARRPVKVPQDTKPRNGKEQSIGRVSSPLMMPQSDIVFAQKMSVIEENQAKDVDSQKVRHGFLLSAFGFQVYASQAQLQ